jgi:hypothetical protein
MIRNGVPVVLKNSKHKKRSKVGLPTNQGGAKLAKYLNAGYISTAYFEPEKIILNK